MKSRVLPLLAVSFFLNGTFVQAQVQIPPAVEPGVLQQREIEREQRIRSDELRRDRIERPVQPSAPPAAIVSGADTVPFTVNEIRFEPASEILKPQELEALVTPYRGRIVKLSELRELVAQINEIYRSKGVVTAQASLPAQDVSDGSVTIRLVEGRVGQILLQGNASTREDYITDRLSLKPRTLVELPRLEDDLVRFNRTNDAQLRVDLQPGTEVGLTDIALTVVEPKRDDLRAFTDNLGSSATGEQRAGVAYTRRSLTGRRDDLFLSVVAAQGHQGHYVTYGLPISSLGTRLTLGYFNDRTKIVNGLIAPLNVSGEATAYSATLKHPLSVSASHQLDATSTLKKRRTVNFISGTPLTAADLSAGSLGLDLQVLDTHGYWTANVEIASGRNRPADAPSRSYTVARGSVRRSFSSDPSLTFNAALNWQYASLQLLPASEQLVIGGEGTVRGYAPGLLAGDRGMVLNLEAQRKIDLSAASGLGSAVFAFLDHGQVSPFRPVNNTRGSDVITSVGGGLQLAYKNLVSARLALGVPLRNRPEETRGSRITLQLTWFLL